MVLILIHRGGSWFDIHVKGGEHSTIYPGGGGGCCLNVGGYRHVRKGRYRDVRPVGFVYFVGTQFQSTISGKGVTVLGGGGQCRGVGSLDP